jgi:hypothetical protein
VPTAVVLALTVIAALAPQAWLARRGAVITGRVVHALTKEPLRGAIVSAAPAAEGVSTTPPAASFLTREDGTFVLRDLPAGTLNVSASKTGYHYDHRAGVPVQSGGRIDNVVIALTPTSLITGRVLDPAGDPVSDATVRAAARGERLTSRASRSATTDDRGIYVIDGLAAGNYVLGAARIAAETTKIPEGQMIAVTAEIGEETAAADLTLPAQPTRLLELSAGGNRANPRRGTGSVAGVVRNAQGRSLSNVLVLATDTGAPGSGVRAVWGRGVSTDDRGAFLIRDLPAGSFTISAARPERFGLASGATRRSIPGVAVRLGDGEHARDLEIVLPTPGTIAGTIRDEFGDPVRASVSLIVGLPLSRRIVSMISRTTDDRGRYRFDNLGPGAFMVMAVQTPAGRLRGDDGSGIERRLGEVPAFFPGVPLYSLATVLSIEAGTELSGIDITARHEPVAPVDLALLAQGLPIAAFDARLMPLHETIPDSLRHSEEPIGFPEVPAGYWQLLVSAVVAAPAGQERHWGSQRITTDGLTPNAATIALEPGARLSGRVEFESTGARPETIEVWLTEVSGTPAHPVAEHAGRIQVAASGVFDVPGLMPGRYAIEPSDTLKSEGWFAKRAVLGGQDVLDIPVDLIAGSNHTDVVLTLTRTYTELSGIVTDNSGQRLGGTEIVIVPTDKRYQWPGSRRVAVRTSANDGAYSIVGLPPGRYRIGRLPSTTAGALFQPPDLDDLAVAATVTLSEGERKVLNVRVQR